MTGEVERRADVRWRTAGAGGGKNGVLGEKRENDVEGGRTQIGLVTWYSDALLTLLRKTSDGSSHQIRGLLGLTVMVLLSTSILNL